MLEGARAALTDPARLVEWLVRLVVVLGLYALGDAALRAWERAAGAVEGADPRGTRARRVASALWRLALLAALAAVTVYSLGLRRLRPLYRWGADLAGWLETRVVGVLAVVAVAYVAWMLVSLLVARLAPGDGFSRRTVRIETLRGVLGSALRIAVVVVAAATVLGNLGVNVTALLAGVSILGLAVSFGAQSLVKDVITGFFILLEDQYGVGDIVRVNGAAGLAGSVEALGLRTTVLRDLEGTAHIIPNGQIETVSVLSKEWSRAVLDVEVAHGVKLDEAIALVGKVAKELHDDASWSERFLEEPEVLGVQALTANGTTIRTLMKVRPKEQWAVAREFRRRVRNAFDAAGLEAPAQRLNLNVNAAGRALIAASGPGDDSPPAGSSST